MEQRRERMVVIEKRRKWAAAKKRKKEEIAGKRKGAAKLSRPNVGTAAKLTRMRGRRLSAATVVNCVYAEIAEHGREK